MKKALLFCVSMMVLPMISAQILVWEDFQGIFPPSGWTSEEAGWKLDPYARAGGASPEAMVQTSTPFGEDSGISDRTGNPRLISPVLDLSGISQVVLEFNSFFISATGGTYGVATRTNTGPWNVVWQTTAGPSPVQQMLSGNFQIRIPVSNQNVNQPGFQFCFYYQQLSMEASNWYVDNVRLYQPLNHDVASQSIPDTVDQHQAGQLFAPFVDVINKGVNLETFTLYHKLYDHQNILVSEKSTVVSNMQPEEIRTVFLPYIALPDPDMVYQSMFITAAPGDMDASNDTVFNYLSTYTTVKQQVIAEVAEPPFAIPGSLPSADEVLSELIAEGKALSVVGYHYGNAFQNSFALSRRYVYYQAIVLPNTIFNGNISHVGELPSMKQAYQSIYDKEIARKTPLEIQLGGYQSGNQYTIVATAKKVAPFQGKAPVLHMILTESGVQNSTGTTNFIERLMIPDEYGTILHFTDTLQVVTKSFNLEPGFSAEHCEVIVFIQDTLGFEILQGAKAPLSSFPVRVQPLEEANPPLVGPAIPNPTTNFASIILHLPLGQQVQANIFNSRGIKVKPVRERLLQTGVAQIAWDGTDEHGNLLPNGLYLFVIDIADHRYIRKVILER